MYCTPSDVWNLFNPDGGNAPSGAGDTSTDDIVAAIEQAQAEVDTRLSTRYTVPFADEAVPRVISSITRDFAVYLVDLAHRGTVDYDSQYDPVLLRRQNADALLARIVDGNANLGPGSQQQVNTGGAGAPRNPHAGPYFPSPMVDPWGRVVDPWCGPGSGYGWGRPEW